MIVGALAVVLAAAIFLLASPAPHSHPGGDLAALGALLFVEPALSGNGAQSCASCHRADRAFAEGTPTARGSTGELHTLNTPSLINAGSLPALGWASPGRASLEAQIAIPLFGARPVEMGALGYEAAILGRLAADPRYPSRFRAAFPADPDPLRWERIIEALAAYVRSLRGSGPYDRYLAGDTAALSATAERGRQIFVEIGCSSCHSGPLLTNSSYHNLGLYGAMDPRGHDRWRVPSLRNVARTAPYFHDGSAATLDDVLDVYVGGGRGAGRASPLRSPAIAPITLSARDRTDLKAFLGALSDDLAVP